MVRITGAADGLMPSCEVLHRFDRAPNRLDRIDELAQIGVHAEVSYDEMQFGLAQTYLLVGELMSRRDTC